MAEQWPRACILLLGCSIISLTPHLTQSSSSLPFICLTCLGLESAHLDGKDLEWLHERRRTRSCCHVTCQRAEIRTRKWTPFQREKERRSFRKPHKARKDISPVQSNRKMAQWKEECRQLQPQPCSCWGRDIEDSAKIDIFTLLY